MPVPIRELLARMQEAILAERDAVRKALGTLATEAGKTVTNGLRLHAEPGAYHYRFRCDAGDRLPESTCGLPEGTRVTLEVPGTLSAGEILDHDLDTNTLEAVLRDDLGVTVPQGRVEFDTTYLLDRLMLRLETLAAAGEGGDSDQRWNLQLATRFIGGLARPEPSVSVLLEGLTPEQSAAVGFILGQPVSYLWGPPGTGKTRTVAHLVHELCRRGERVILTAHTNVATDTALLRVLASGSLPPETVVRVGYQSEALRSYQVGLDDVADRTLRRQHPNTVQEIAEVCAAVSCLTGKSQATLLDERLPAALRLRIARSLLAATDDPDQGASEWTERLTALGETVREVECNAIRTASVVATTLTRLYIDRRLETVRTDALVLDEASIASKALAFVAACFARKRAVAAGDFMQLPAIVQAAQPIAQTWLGQHVFNGAGCDRAEADHPLRAMLKEQWRMHPQISSLVSRVFYAGKLRDAPAVLARSQPGPAVLLLDTSRTGAKTQATGTGSKRNLEHARLVAGLVRQAARRDIAIITPYRAQVRVIRDAIREVRPDDLASGRIEVFTVHRFQGRDKRLVIFDTCEAPPSRAAFLSELQNPHAPNLINVALSRAMEQLVVICHTSHLTRTLGRSSLLNRMLAQARELNALERVAGCAADDADVARFLGDAGR